MTFTTPPSGLASPLPDILEDHYNDVHHHLQRTPQIIKKSFWAGGLLFAAVILVIIIGFLILERKAISRFYYRSSRRILRNSAEGDPIELQTFTSELTICCLENETEVSLDSLAIADVIGQGAFGLVRKAVITIGEKEEMVAVKMLRRHANEDYLREFGHEIDVMKSVGSHPNIVGLIGHSKTSRQGNMLKQGPMMILIEYCDKGNLLDYLRWGAF